MNLDMDMDVQSSFRRTSRDYHVTKNYAAYLHGPAPGRYNPSYSRVEGEPIEISMIGKN